MVGWGVGMRKNTVNVVERIVRVGNRKEDTEVVEL